MKESECILIADDVEMNRVLLSETFRGEYEIIEADNGVLAMDIIRCRPNLSIVLLDLVMPGRTGYEVLEMMRSEGYLDHIPVIVVTSEDSSESEVRSFDLGASDLITKPFEPHVVKRRVNNLIDLYRHKNQLEHLVETQAQKLQASNEALIDALSSVIEYRNLESGQHIRRIRLFTKILLNRVVKTPNGPKWDARDVSIIASAASMHDIGKIAIPDSILNKPGRLTAEEFEVMKTHSAKGGEIIRNISWMNDREYLHYAYEICRHHHERWDGRGYPDGLKGDEIPACALVVSIADVYDALTSERIYKPPYPHSVAVSMIIGGECGLFPDWLLRCFQDVEEEFSILAAKYADQKTPLPVHVPASAH